MPASEDAPASCYSGHHLCLGNITVRNSPGGLFHIQAHRKGTLLHLCVCSALSHPRSATVLTVTLWALPCHKPYAFLS